MHFETLASSQKFNQWKSQNPDDFKARQHNCFSKASIKSVVVKLYLWIFHDETESFNLLAIDTINLIALSFKSFSLSPHSAMLFNPHSTANISIIDHVSLNNNTSNETQSWWPRKVFLDIKRLRKGNCNAWSSVELSSNAWNVEK